ncbi:uncharacterized protein MAM_07334 [Metarhizium album ARSEF 1941]|uniref:Uncharacterized protein n=1 Tax=Metarhizium album (strain ARSEF 1941) TaxID=1081103 RepID=A0A0B2WLE0_METAS|nr:uncharacterized protein MAM_07334 [Metarhizium album ARSEF 1941]KHN94738.1 hypothetical protein MAM_07334 [Metarhizium album ARSEF 1941]
MEEDEAPLSTRLPPISKTILQTSPAFSPRRPAIGSLHDVLRRDNSTEWLVSPEYWTDKHSQVLGADFEELPPFNVPVPQYIPGAYPSRGDSCRSSTVKLLDGLLSDSLPNGSESGDEKAIGSIVAILWPYALPGFYHGLMLPIFLGDCYHPEAVLLPMAWPCPPESSLPSDFAPSPGPDGHPMRAMCYITKDRLAAMRRELIFPEAYDEAYDPITSRVYRLKAKARMPANSNHDPYLVAMFLAMAQDHFHQVPPSAHRRRQRSGIPSAGPAFKDLKLRILLHDTQTRELIVHTGHITSNFLEYFYDPHNVPTSTQGQGDALGMKIQYTRVPMWPVIGLKERLGMALGEDLVGQFDPLEVETWDQENEKHHAMLVERFDKEGVATEPPEESCDEESFDGECSPPKAKRQKLQESDGQS